MIPNRLLDSGRIKAKSVFIITNVDNRHHINIVHDFNKYLKVRRATVKYKNRLKSISQIAFPFVIYSNLGIAF